MGIGLKTNMSRKDQKHTSQLLRSLSMVSQMGMTIAACVLVGVLLGRFLDSIFDTSPWLLIALSLCGAAAGFRSIFELAKK